ncbi:hypothetical protein [Saccharicrinis sp. GN24d3]|uniref:hypothetical protein n=1 Tax=Saccharicrinis sp. GN24d3 TaxID=3458416 RepID=UPI0040364D42
MIQQYKVYIDPSSKILYSSYYIKGLYDCFGKKHVTFSSKPFIGLKKRKDNELFDHFMAFVIAWGGTEYKFIVDFWDKTLIDEYAYHWCDAYAKINVSKESVFEKDKLVPIPPGFGIKIWNKKDSLIHCLKNYFISKRDPHIKFSRHWEDYMDQYERPAIKAYENNDSDILNKKPYIFMIGRLWPHVNCIKTTNPLRREFIRVCKKLDVEFEGGLFANSNHPEYEAYKDVSFTSKVDVQTYVRNTKKSILVFNTPAVHDCHGWKLAEYFAMGKAIVTTKLSNYIPLDNDAALPIHEVSTVDNIESDVKLLIEDAAYRNDLKNRARKYYNNVAKPSKVIEVLVKKVIPGFQHYARS